MFSRRALLACLLIGGVVVSGTALAADSFSIEIDSTVAVPQETVSSPESDATFTISEVGVVTQGDSLTVDATPPNGTEYFVFFRDEEGNVVIRTDRLAEPQSVKLNTSAEPAGSYVLTIGPDSTPKDVLPVVIEAYQVNSVTMEVGETTSRGQEFTMNATESADVRVDLTQQAEVPITTANLTVWNEADGVVKTVPLSVNRSADAEHVYEGALSDVATGSYNVQIRVHGESEVNGQRELIGLSANRGLTVTKPSEDERNPDDSETGETGDETSDDTQEPGGDNENGDSPDENTNSTDDDDKSTGRENTTSDGESTDTDSQENTDDTETGSKQANGSENTAGGGTQQGDTGTTQDDSGTNETDDSSADVITPNDPTGNDDTNDSVPFGGVTKLLLIVVTGAIVFRVRTH